MPSALSGHAAFSPSPPRVNGLDCILKCMHLAIIKSSITISKHFLPILSSLSHFPNVFTLVLFISRAIFCGYKCLCYGCVRTISKDQIIYSGAVLSPAPYLLFLHKSACGCTRTMHSSFFEYNISRPYPFKWFTPVVVIGGAVAVVLLSILNLGSSGYTQTVQYSHDPNTTVSNETSSKYWRSFPTTKPRATCQSVNIPINTRLLTNNTALTYTLTNVSQNTDRANQTFSSSLVYHNNILPDCTINNIAVRLESLGRTAAQIALTKWGVDAQAYISCNLDTNDQRRTVFNLTAEYNYIPDTVSVYSGFYTFVGRNERERASLYWGESLLSMYSLQLDRDVFSANLVVDDHRVSQGVVTFTPNGSTTDFTRPDFFDMLFRFIAPKPDNSFEVWPPDQVPGLSTDPQEWWAAVDTWADDFAAMDMWSSVDSFAKSLYSTVLADLGQRSSYPNILTDARLLEHFTSNFSQMYEDYTIAGPAKAAFSTLNSTGSLGINPSVLAATYLCEVPRQKPMGTLIVSILVADLVFLQALWILLKLVVEAYLTRKDKQANLCEGCLGQKELLDGSEVVSLRPTQVRRESSYEMVAIDKRESLLAP